MADFMPNKLNMYNCTRCPECGENHRYILADRPTTLICDDCGFEEERNENNNPRGTE